VQYHRERISFVFSDQYIASNIFFVVVLVFDSHDSCFLVFLHGKFRVLSVGRGLEMPVEAPIIFLGIWGQLPPCPPKWFPPGPG